MTYSSLRIFEKSIQNTKEVKHKVTDEDYDSIEGILEAAEEGEFENFEEYNEEAKEYVEEGNPRDSVLYLDGATAMLSEEVDAKQEHWEDVADTIDSLGATVEELAEYVQEYDGATVEDLERYRELIVTHSDQVSSAVISAGEELEALNDMMDEGIEELERIKESAQVTPETSEELEDERVLREEARDVVNGLTSRRVQEETEE